ncbi:hypothetical protein ACS0TY_014763 [Phlomoides rotata]
MINICLAVVVIAIVLFVLGLKPRKLPPGPYPFPIIGNVLQLGSNPHQSFANLSKTYGPLMSLQHGKIYVVVVSSLEMAKQPYSQHCDGDPRLPPEFNDPFTHRKQMAKSSKICREHLFSAQRIEGSVGLRREKERKLCQYLQECCLSGRAINVGETAFATTFNILSSTLYSTDFGDYDSDASREFKGICRGFDHDFGNPNLADFFPLLKWVDPQGIKKLSEICIGNSIRMFGDIINQRLQPMDDSPKTHDLLQTLLDLRDESEDSLSINDIKYLFLWWLEVVNLKLEKIGDAVKFPTNCPVNEEDETTAAMEKIESDFRTILLMKLIFAIKCVLIVNYRV